MYRNFKKVGIIVLCGLLLTAAAPSSLRVIDKTPSSTASVFGNLPDSMGLNAVSADASIYFVEEINAAENKFVNQVDGYSISIPKDMKVVDMSCPGIRSVLEDEHRRIEIYRESTTNGVSAQTYVGYSNRFLNNNTDHHSVSQQQLSWQGMDLNVVTWSRDKLRRVKDDKNYYACVDIAAQDAVYTFFIKSDVPLDQSGGYQDIIKDFASFAPRKESGPVRFQHSVQRQWNPETAALFEKCFGDNSPLQWGIFEPAAPFSMGDLQNLEQRMEYEFPFILLYSHVANDYDPHREGQALRNAYANNKIVELTLQTTAADGGNMVYEVLDGLHDAYLYNYAQKVADFGHPVLFRPFNEMNGDWCAYSAYHTSRDTDLFKELYRYIFDIFTEVGADNVIWVWNPNEKSFPDFKWNNEIMYYPGDKYVDVVGLTGYNTGTYYNGETWRSFSEIYDPIYKKATALYDKPLMITEFASSSIGASKEQWVQDMFQHITKYPKIKIAIWWDGRDLDDQGNIARPYFIDETDQLVEIFRENLRSYRP